MEINLSQNVRELILAFLMLILPWIVIIVGVLVTIENAWYFVLAITWFGSGLIFFMALTDF
jgi:hypothetical protein